MTDFGFARMSEEDSAVSHISTQVKGTAGYLDPDYLRTYQLTEKSDVYSFGVLLVEMMTGRYPIESKKPMKERVTIRWVSTLMTSHFVIIPSACDALLYVVHEHYNLITNVCNAGNAVLKSRRCNTCNGSKTKEDPSIKHGSRENS